MAEEDDQAIAQLHKALDMNMDLPITHLWLGRVYTHKRMFGQAIAEFQNAVTLSGGQPFYLTALGYGYAVSGQESDAAKILVQLTQLSTRKYVPAYEMAVSLCAAGAQRPGVALAAKGREDDREDNCKSIRADRDLDPLRSDPHFQQLERRIGLGIQAMPDHHHPEAS